MSPSGPIRPRRIPTVLVVEDDNAIRTTIVEFLEFEGYSVGSASNGREAIEVVSQGTPRVILVDVRMPVMNGIEFARTLRDRNITIPLVVMTAAPEDRHWAASIGAVTFLAKPFDLVDLGALLKSVLAGKEL